MDIEQVRVARRELEDSIQLMISEALTAFRTKTGLCPRSIDVRLVELTSLGEREKQYVVGEVYADVPL